MVSMRSMTARSRRLILRDRQPVSSGSICLVAAIARGHVCVLNIGILVVIVVLVIFIIVVVLIIVFGVRNNYDLPQNLVELVSAILLVTSPLDEDVETQLLDGSSCVGPRRLTQELVIACMSMPDVGHNGKLHSSGQRKVRCQSNERHAIRCFGSLEWI
jgi:hypothetical protein